MLSILTKHDPRTSNTRKPKQITRAGVDHPHAVDIWFKMPDPVPLAVRYDQRSIYQQEDTYGKKEKH